MTYTVRAATAVVLAAVLVLAVSPVGMARFSDVPPGAPYADAVALLAELGITTGISETEFGPDLELTRQQFAVFVIRAQRQAEIAESLAGRPTDFTDDAAIAGWARGHVALAAGAGIVNGYPDGTFKPEGLVTQAEALTMLVRALGFRNYADANGGFPTGYLLAAQELGLTEGMGLTGANQPMLRWQMAVALVNALNAPRTANPDGSPNPAAPGAAGSTWLGDLWEREPSLVHEGQVERIQAGSRRITVAGRTFQWNDDTEVQFNNEPRSFKVDEIITDPFRYLAEGKRVAVTYLGDEARRINLITDYFPEAREVVDVRAREGRVTVFAVVFQVSDETLTLLNGEPITLARLEQVHAGFKERYGRGPVARLRVYGSSPSNPLIYLSVSTETVSGVIDRQGSDRDGRWLEIDGRRYNVETIPAADLPAVGRPVTLLLDDQGRAVSVLVEVAALRPYYAVVKEYVHGSGSRGDSVVLERGDGTEVTLQEDDFEPSAWLVSDAIIGRPVAVDPAVPAVSSVLVLGDSGTVQAVTGTYLRVNGTNYVFDDRLLVFDASEGRAVGRDAVTTGERVELYMLPEGVLGMVVVNP